MSKYITILAGLLALTIPLTAENQRHAPESDDLGPALRSFIQAFDNLDWDKFRAFFADDATVFYPRKAARRAQGRTEFEGEFKKVFEGIRAGRTSPPYMDIQPRDLRVQMAGDVAIVTFHLDDRPGFLNRRTLVWKRSSAGWKIIHLHASEVAIAPPAGP